MIRLKVLAVRNRLSVFGGCRLSFDMLVVSFCHGSDLQS